MLVHSVYFWLKSELTPEQLADFADGLRSLAAIETVKTIYVGKPVPSDRPVVESSYTYGLVIGFDDQQGLDAYQVHPVHVAFVERFKPYWMQIKVYDVE
ncbi:MAG: Dabb family protein [Armatimonadota bacterium]